METFSIVAKHFVTKNCVANLIQELGQQICRIVFRGNVDVGQLFHFDLVANEVPPESNVFGSRVMSWIVNQ